MAKNQILYQPRLLTEVESKELLKQAGIPIIETKLAKNKKEAISIAKEIGFPVVLKINSPQRCCSKWCSTAPLG